MTGEPQVDHASPASHAPPRARGPAWTVAGLTLLALVAYAVSTVPGVRDRAGFDPVLDGWLQGGAYVLAALLAGLRPLLLGGERRLWGLVAAAVGLRSLGFVVFLGLVRRLEPQPYPSGADAAWLLSAVLLAAVLLQLLRRSAPRITRSLVLDACLAGVAVTAVSTAILSDLLPQLTARGAPARAVVTNLTYPVLDVVLVILVVGLLAAVGRQVSPATLAITAGVSCVAVVDVVFLVQVVTGGFRPGTALGAVSLLGTVLVAGSGWLPDSPPGTPPQRGPMGLVMPGVLVAVCILTLVYGAATPGQLVANVIAALGVGVGVTRVGILVSQQREEASAAIEAGQLELQRFRSLVEASADMVGIADMQGRLLYLNPSGRQLIGLAPDADVTGMRVADTLTEEGREVWQRERRPTMLAQGVARMESTLRHQVTGRSIPVAISSFVIRHPATGEPWLLGTVQKDISERVAAEQTLQALADQRSTLLSHLVQAQEDERARIAADVHDDSVQALAAVELRLQVMHQQLVTANPDLLDDCGELQVAVRGASERLRHLLFDLESPARRTDLATALEEAAAFVLEDAVAWDVEVRDEPALSTADRVTAYRVAKEAITNARKHARASRVVIRLGVLDGGLLLTVTDDGHGFRVDEADPQPGHLGLPGMRDRAAVAGGRLEVSSEPGTGTTVTLWLPPSADGDPEAELVGER